MAIPPVPVPALAPQAPGAQAPTNRITVYGRTFEVVLYTINPQGAKSFQQMGALSAADLQNIQTIASQALATIGQSPHWANVTGIDHHGVTVSTPGQQPQTYTHIDQATNTSRWTPVEQAVNSAFQGVQPANTTAANPTTTSGGVAPTHQHPLPVPPNPAIQATHMSVFQHQPGAITNLNQLTYTHIMGLPPRARLRALTNIQNGSLQINQKPSPAALTQDIADCTTQISALVNPNLDDTTRQAIDALYATRLSGNPPAFQSLLAYNFTGREHLIDYYHAMANAQGIKTPSLQIPNDDPGKFINFWQQATNTNPNPNEYADAVLCLVEALAYFADEDAALIKTTRQPILSNWGMLGSIANGAVSTVTTVASAVTTVCHGVNWALNGVNSALNGVNSALGRNQPPTSTPSNTVTGNSSSPKRRRPLWQHQ